MAVTVTYFWGPNPSTGSYFTGTTPPTAAQIAAFPFTQLRATVNFGSDTDTVATVTHNQNLSTAALNNQQPLVMLTPAAVGTAGGQYAVNAAFSANAIQITKASTVAGSGETTFNVVIFAPSSFMG